MIEKLLKWLVFYLNKPSYPVWKQPAGYQAYNDRKPPKQPQWGPLIALIVSGLFVCSCCFVTVAGAAYGYGLNSASSVEAEITAEVTVEITAESTAEATAEITEQARLEMTAEATIDLEPSPTATNTSIPTRMVVSATATITSTPTLTPTILSSPMPTATATIPHRYSQNNTQLPSDPQQIIVSTAIQIAPIQFTQTPFVVVITATSSPTATSTNTLTPSPEPELTAEQTEATE